MAQPPRSGLSITHGLSRGKKKLPVLLRLSKPLHTHTDHDCGSYGVTEVYATSADPVWYLGRVRSGFAAIWINKHKRAGTWLNNFHPPRTLKMKGGCPWTCLCVCLSCSQLMSSRRGFSGPDSTKSRWFPEVYIIKKCNFNVLIFFFYFLNNSLCWIFQVIHKK